MIDVLLIIFLSIIIVNAAILFFIAFRKMSELRRLEVSRFQMTKEKKVKKKILEERLLRFWKNRFRIISHVVAEGASTLWRLVERLKTLEETYRHLLFVRASQEERREQSQQLVAKGTALIELKDWPSAERAFIEALRLSPKNIAAYEGLAGIYSATKQYALAKATLSHILQKIDPAHGATMVRLGLVHEALGNHRGAVSLFEKALAHQLTDLSLLELLFSGAVRLKNRRLAQAVLEQFKVAQPEYLRLQEFQQIVEDMV